MKQHKKMMRVGFPYCIQKQPDGSYILLNRDYKPVGFLKQDWLDYSAYPVSFKFKRLTKSTIMKLSVHGDPGRNEIFLYDDGTIPTRNQKNMEDYLEKLTILMSLAVEGK